MEILEADGDLVALADRPGGMTRYVRLEVAAPGHDLRRVATYEYEEWYARTRRGWELTDHQYEIRLDPPRQGRKGYHWHDLSYHVHCAATRIGGDGHYRGYRIDLLEDARPDFLSIYAAGHVNCSGLRPLR